jgi:hypothetical protein
LRPSRSSCRRCASARRTSSRSRARSCARTAAPTRPRIDDGAAERLIAYGWPGNTRELELVVQSALIQTPAGARALDAVAVTSSIAACAMSPEVLEPQAEESPVLVSVPGGRQRRAARAPGRGGAAGAPERDRAGARQQEPRGAPAQGLAQDAVREAPSPRPRHRGRRLVAQLARGADRRPRPWRDFCRLVLSCRSGVASPDVSRAEPTPHS